MLVPMWQHKELPLVRCIVEHEGQSIELDALVDTGSAGTMLKTEIAESLGMHYMQAESVMAVYGIGGRETVYTHDLNRLIIGNHAAIDFYVEVGEMNYGLQIDAIVGVDVLSSIGAIIRMGPMVIEFEE
ncbi:MAG: retropepsin-like aspartic protease [Ardenticatenaceae bacterium]